MLGIMFLLLQHLIVKKLRRTLRNNLYNFLNLPTFMNPSLVPRVLWDQGFCNPVYRACPGVLSGI